MLVGFGWALVAGVAAAVLVVALGRPRLAGLVTVGILVTIGAVITDVVRSERPFPNAGWPSRFDWLHGLGLFAAVCLAAAGRGRQASSAAPIAPPARMARNGENGRWKRGLPHSSSGTAISEARQTSTTAVSGRRRRPPTRSTAVPAVASTQITAHAPSASVLERIGGPVRHDAPRRRAC